MIVLDEPGVRAKIAGGDLNLGDRVKAVLTKADPTEHRVEVALK